MAISPFTNPQPEPFRPKIASTAISDVISSTNCFDGDNGYHRGSQHSEKHVRSPVAPNTRAFDDLKTLLLANEASRSAVPNLHPSVELLEQARRERQAQITSWRDMVTEIQRRKLNAGAARRVRSLIEEHPEYLSLRARMTPTAVHIVEGTVVGRQAELAMAATQSQSTIPFALRVLSDEIDRIEREWRLA